MRIRHVVTYAGSSGEFGGPTRVAIDLAVAQAHAGHEVEVVAGGDPVGIERLDNGAILSLFKVRWPLRVRFGFATMSSPAMLRYVKRSHGSADVHHVHLARDMTTIPVALALRWYGARYVAQTHGMIDASSRTLAHVLDAVGTRRALTGAAAVAALTSAEAEELARLGVDESRLRVLPNGVAPAPVKSRPRDLVLFLARLHPRKGAVEFTRAAALIHERWPEYRFVIAGPDEGDGDELRALIKSSGDPENLEYVGGVTHEQALDLMSCAALYVLPARDEPFGLTIIEALSAGAPALVHESAALAPRLVESQAGFKYGDEGLVAVLDSLLADPQGLAAAGRRGLALVADEYSLDQVAKRVEQMYEKATEC